MVRNELWQNCEICRLNLNELKLKLRNELSMNENPKRLQI